MYRMSSTIQHTFYVIKRSSKGRHPASKKFNFLNHPVEWQKCYIKPIHNRFFCPKGKMRGAFVLPKGARHVYLNESDGFRNVFGELNEALQRHGHPH